MLYKKERGGDWDGGGNVGGPARTVEMGLWVGYDPGPGDVQVGVIGYKRKQLSNPLLMTYLVLVSSGI